MVDWLIAYACGEDPFAAKPLTTTTELGFFYATTSIKNSLHSIMEKGTSGIYGISGLRGVGKTSTLHYIGGEFRRKGDIVVGIRAVEDVGVKISPESLAMNLIGSILEDLVKEIYENYNDVYRKNQKFFEAIIKQIGYEEIENRLFPIRVGNKEYDLQRKFVNQSIKILNDESYSITILIDNLDKFMTEKNKNLLREFLSGPFAQSFFEEITLGSRVKIFISLSSEIYDFLKSGNEKWQGLNYLASTIELHPLKDIEAFEKRIFHQSK